MMSIIDFVESLPAEDRSRLFTDKTEGKLRRKASKMRKVSQYKVYEVFWSQSAMTWNKQGSTYVASDAGPEWASQVVKKQLRHESSLDQAITNWRIDDVVEDPDGGSGLVHKAE